VALKDDSVTDLSWGGSAAGHRQYLAILAALTRRAHRRRALTLGEVLADNLATAGVDRMSILAGVAERLVGRLAPLEQSRAPRLRRILPQLQHWALDGLEADVLLAYARRRH
jgi:hypothetical protein